MMESYAEKASDNYTLIKKEIEQLSISHWRIPHVIRNYGSFWIHAKEISKMFKSLKPLRKEDRIELWGMYSKICEEVKENSMRDPQKLKD